MVEFLGGWLKSKNDDFAAFFLVKDAQLENGGFHGTEGWFGQRWTDWIDRRQTHHGDLIENLAASENMMMHQIHR